MLPAFSDAVSRRMDRIAFIRVVSALLCNGDAQIMSEVGHVWTAPWQELSDVLQHWSGAVTCWCGGYGRWP
jgi:hypothetical protein